VGIFSRLFGADKKEAATSSQNIIKNAFSFLATDMHSHLLPGIDDGAQTINDSIQLIRSLMELGYSGFITTPHIKSDIYRNTPHTINNALQEVKQALVQHNIQVPIHAAAEYYMDDHFLEMLEEKQLLTLYKNEVLVEFSFMFEPIRLPETIFRIQTNGYKPVFAHPERYPYYHHNLEMFREIKARGGLLQLNTLSLLGYYGNSVRECAEWILKEGLYDYCGTDLHHIKHIEGLQKFTQTKIYAQLRSYPFLNRKLTVSSL
jgi:tyrosine-protein phosphatase YwqE